MYAPGVCASLLARSVCACIVLIMLRLHIMYTTDPVREFARNVQVQAAIDALAADYRSTYAAAVEHAETALGIDAGADEQHIMIQRAFVTPLRICVLPPEIETLNRVLRHFKKRSHRFMRVVFRSASQPVYIVKRSIDAPLLTVVWCSSK
jgi:RNA dependent RNA polymerase